MTCDNSQLLCISLQFEYIFSFSLFMKIKQIHEIFFQMCFVVSYGSVVVHFTDSSSVRFRQQKRFFVLDVLIKLQRNNLQFQTQRPSNTGNYTRLYKVSLRCSARVQHRKM